MNPRFEEKSATECEKQIAGLGKTHQEIIRSLLAAEHTLLKNLYDCMEEDFFFAQTGGSVKLPKIRDKGRTRTIGHICCIQKWSWAISKESFR